MKKLRKWQKLIYRKYRNFIVPLSKTHDEVNAS